MPAGIYNFTIEQGATFNRVVTWKDAVGNPINLTGFIARLHIREGVTTTTPFLTLTTENGGIELGGAAGTITLRITATATAAIVLKKGVYDLELQSGDGTVTRLLEGKVTVSPEVTR